MNRMAAAVCRCAAAISLGFTNCTEICTVLVIPALSPGFLIWIVRRPASPVVISSPDQLSACMISSPLHRNGLTVCDHSECSQWPFRFLSFIQSLSSCRSMDASVRSEHALVTCHTNGAERSQAEVDKEIFPRPNGGKRESSDPDQERWNRLKG